MDVYDHNIKIQGHLIGEMANKYYVLFKSDNLVNVVLEK